MPICGHIIYQAAEIFIYQPSAVSGKRDRPSNDGVVARIIGRVCRPAVDEEMMGSAALT
jgi:hypothetical protein